MNKTKTKTTFAAVVLLAMGAVAEEAAPTASPSPLLHPYLIVVGGANYERVVNLPAAEGLVDDERESRVWTVALTRMGIDGYFGAHVYARSELEVAAGPHGTSVWEGQAALTVRDQFLRLYGSQVAVDLGRITDPASIDYFSEHVANMLLTDFQLRLPFLQSGANRGNGVLARYEPVSGLKLGLTLNAGNPVSNTATAALGGTYPPFSRFYYNTVGTVRDSASRFPSDLFHVMIASPSVTFERSFLRAQVGYQFFDVDVTMSDRDNPHLRGHNFRGGVQALLLGGHLKPFVNGSYTRNLIHATSGASVDVSALSADRFQAITWGGGLDYDFGGGLGVGGQLNVIQEQQGKGSVFQTYLVNVGASIPLFGLVALQPRYSFSRQCEEEGEGCYLLDQQHNFYLTVLGKFGGAPAPGARTF